MKSAERTSYGRFPLTSETHSSDLQGLPLQISGTSMPDSSSWDTASIMSGHWSRTNNGFPLSIMLRHLEMSQDSPEFSVSLYFWERILQASFVGLLTMASLTPCTTWHTSSCSGLEYPLWSFLIAHHYPLFHARLCTLLILAPMSGPKKLCNCNLWIRQLWVYLQHRTTFSIGYWAWACILSMWWTPSQDLPVLLEEGHVEGGRREDKAIFSLNHHVCKFSSQADH